MFPVHSKVGKENLVLRHSVAHFPPKYVGIAFEWRNSMCFTSEPRNEHLNLKNFLEWVSNPQPVVFVPLGHD